jgi:hypothetical protein
MTWSCPNCEIVAVCSRHEWQRVYNYRAQIKSRARRLANTLTARGFAVRSHEDAADACRRWADQDRDGGIAGPRYICAQCVRAWSNQEVPV